MIVAVCTAFGHYVKFTVTLNEPGVSSIMELTKDASISDSETEDEDTDVFPK